MAQRIFTDESLGTLVDEIKSYTDNAVSAKANSSHNHAASNITSGTLSSSRLPTVPITKGGTGATTAAAALTNLGLTATATELNYVDGVTSNIQTQLDSKASSNHSHDTHSQKSMSNTDLNTIKTAGWYYGYTGMTNAPAQSISVMEVLVYSPDWIVQRFIVVNGAEYIRHWHSANTWSNWKTNVDSGNISSQSVNYALSSTTATNVAWNGVTSKPSYYDAKAIKGITRSGTTFTYTCMDGTTGTFTQQDNNTTYSVATTSANGLMSSTDKSKLDGIANDANKYTHPSYTARTGVPTANATLSHGGTFTVTQPVCDATGHITALNTRTYTLPSDNNTDTKVTNTLATTTKAYVTGTTSTTTNTGTQVFDTGVYLDTTAGQLTATTFNGTTFKGSGVATVSEVKTYLSI